MSDEDQDALAKSYVENVRARMRNKLGETDYLIYGDEIESLAKQVEYSLPKQAEYERRKARGEEAIGQSLFKEVPSRLLSGSLKTVSAQAEFLGANTLLNKINTDAVELAHFADAITNPEYDDSIWANVLEGIGQVGTQAGEAALLVAGGVAEAGTAATVVFGEQAFRAIKNTYNEALKIYDGDEKEALSLLQLNCLL